MMRWMVNIKNWYLNQRMQTKLMVTYLIIISFPMLVLVFSFLKNGYSMIVSDTIRSAQEESASTAPAIEDAVEEVLSDHLALTSLPFYTQLINNKSLLPLKQRIVPEDAKAFPLQVEDIINRGVIQDVRIYLDLPESEISALNVPAAVLIPLSAAPSTYWRGIFSGSGNLTRLHCPAFYLSSYEIENLGDMAYITKNTLQINGEKIICYTAVYYSSELFLNILNNQISSESSVAYIVNERDTIITTTNPALSGTYYLNYATIGDYFMSSNNFLKKDVLDQEIYAAMYNIKQTSWYMVVVIPSQPLVIKSRLLLLEYLLVFGVSLIAALVIAILMSRSVTRRIAMITGQMAKVRSGPPVPLPESIIHDEIGDLINTYNYMSAEMNHLLAERDQAAEELRIAEFNSLQAQINPHFLYNTMDMINWMAAQGKTRGVADAVQSLSRFYKLTLSKKETLSTIEQEIEHVSIYIRLQNMRFQDGIDFVVDIPDEILDIQIPKLTLQPIVENSILHGIMEKECKKGTVLLTGWIDAQTLELLITDDGMGMSPQQLSSILDGNGSGQNGSNIAIYNTHHRLQLLYGEAYGLSYQSRSGKGTEVSVRLPARKMTPNHTGIKANSNRKLSISVL